MDDMGLVISSYITMWQCRKCYIKEKNIGHVTCPNVHFGPSVYVNLFVLLFLTKLMIGVSFVRHMHGI